MNSQELIKRTNKFAHRTVKLSLALPKNMLGQHIANQLIRCSTSVAANYRATVLAQSKASFKAKMSIVLEEVDESLFWIDFLIDEDLVGKTKVNPLREEANELKAIFFAARKTLSMG